MAQAQTQIVGAGALIKRLNIIKAVVLNEAMLTMESVSKDIAIEAKDKCPVDTGALRASIKSGMERKSIVAVKGFVSAGSDDITRGIGEFERSEKTGNRRDPQATNEYAVKANNQTPFFDSAFKYGQDRLPRQLSKRIRKALGVL